MFVNLVLVMLLVVPALCIDCPEEAIYSSSFKGKQYTICKCAFCAFSAMHCDKCLGIKDDRYECSDDVCGQDPPEDRSGCEGEDIVGFQFKPVEGKPEYYQYCASGVEAFSGWYNIKVKCASGGFNPDTRQCDSSISGSAPEAPPPPPAEPASPPDGAFEGQRDSFNLCPDEFIFPSRYGSKIYWTCSCADCDWKYATCDTCLGIKDDKYECSNDVCNFEPQPQDYQCEKDKDEEFQFTAVEGKPDYFQFCVRDLGPDELTADTMHLVKLKCACGSFHPDTKMCDPCTPGSSPGNSPTAECNDCDCDCSCVSLN